MIVRNPVDYLEVFNAFVAKQAEFMAFDIALTIIITVILFVIMLMLVHGIKYLGRLISEALERDG